MAGSIAHVTYRLVTTPRTLTGRRGWHSVQTVVGGDQAAQDAARPGRTGTGAEGGKARPVVPAG
jgi:hypothetical protein